MAPSPLFVLSKSYVFSGTRAPGATQGAEGNEWKEGRRLLAAFGAALSRLRYGVIDGNLSSIRQLMLLHTKLLIASWRKVERRPDMGRPVDPLLAVKRIGTAVRPF